MDVIAQVIVDVPTMQTNQSYDYKVPEALKEVIQVGMRVVVPFGQGSRRVQAFVVGLTTATDFSGDLKEVDEVMDLEPVLNDELLELGRVMGDRTYSFAISCYQAFLPVALKAKYEKHLQVIDDLPEELEAEIFSGRSKISWQEMLDRGISDQLKKLIGQKKVKIRYEVKDRRTYKTEKMVKSLLNFHQIQEEKEGLSSAAYKQALLLDVLEAMGEDVKARKKLEAEYGLASRDFKTGEEKGWLRLFDERVFRDPYQEADITPTQALDLTDQQKQADQEVVEAIDHNDNQVFLLQGVTGSGKTEVYMQSIAHALKLDKTALVLVPEISLTPQMVHRFKGRFGDRVAVMHSGLSDGERYDEWVRVMNREADVVVGARSSIFSPLENIGLIIIDEEHESSYKQNENPRYHARRVAKWRGDYHGCPVILGSATPSLESRARADKGVYQLLKMDQRPTGQDLPDVEVIDMTQEAKSGNFSDFSESMLQSIEDRLAKKEQTILMLNRRGYSSFMMCRDCGFVLPCQNCDISLTLHMDSRTMKCHYCGHEEGIPQHCPQCSSSTIRYYGTGTQKVQETLEELLPQARILRMDRDTTRRKGQHEKILDRFGRHEADILLGTQMIAKGLDFPKVTLVGVLNADTGLNLPDFRSSEKTFQLLTQVAGRAGRGEESGQVLVQTYNPDHYAIQLAKHHDYERFYKYEMLYRHQGNYSPYYYTLRISVSHEDERQAYLKIWEMKDQLQSVLSDQAIVLGPTPHAIARTKNKYHYQMIIKYKSEPQLHSAVHDLMESNQKAITQGLLISIDPEPTSFL